TPSPPIIYSLSLHDALPISRPLAFGGLTLIVIGRLAINQFRWWYLPFMRKPVPMTPRPSWKVGVATTFVPGAEPIEMLEETIRRSEEHTSELQSRVDLVCRV